MCTSRLPGWKYLDGAIDSIIRREFKNFWWGMGC